MTNAPLPVIPIAEVRCREPARVHGRVRTVRILPTSVELVLVDGTGGLTVVLSGGRALAGVHPGSKMSAGGLVEADRGRMAMIDPSVEIDQRSTRR